MKLVQSEIIQILRKRRGLNQGDLGAKAFNTSFESGRTKIKNIELGRQAPTMRDLDRLATVLDVSVHQLIPQPAAAAPPSVPVAAGHIVDQVVLDRFPGLEAYVDMLNSAVKIGDAELTRYIASKIAHLLETQAATDTTDTRQAG